MDQARVSGDDVQGHSRWSDEKLKDVITQIENALQALQGLATDEDVQGHMARWSDETLKDAVTQIENALQALQGLATDDVQGHKVWSDETLKDAVTQIENALAALKAISAQGS